MEIMFDLIVELILRIFLGDRNIKNLILETCRNLEGEWRTDEAIKHLARNQHVVDK